MEHANNKSAFLLPGGRSDESRSQRKASEEYLRDYIEGIIYMQH